MEKGAISRAGWSSSGSVGCTPPMVKSHSEGEGKGIKIVDLNLIPVDNIDRSPSGYTLVNFAQGGRSCEDYECGQCQNS